MRVLCCLMVIFYYTLFIHPYASAAEATPPAQQQQEEELDAAGAQKLLDQGNRALRDSNETPSRAVDAALAFVKALTYYERVGDTERICDLQAAIFWCKKRMNLDEAKRFIAAKGGSKQDEDLLAVAEKVAARAVTSEDAQTYFDRADKFARENPTAYGLITVRWFEIAERFAGTDLGRKAHALSLAAQKKDMELLAAERLAKLETVFSQPEPQIDDTRRIELPEGAPRKAAALALRKEHKDNYAKKLPAQRARFAKRLAKEAENTALPTLTRAALLDEALDLAGDANDFGLTLVFAEQQARIFRGAGIRERQRQALEVKRGNPNAAALIKLLSEPLDPAANLTVGRYFCLDLGRWDEGVPMLARGGTSDLSEQAAMELIKPEGWMQQVELADRWYSLGKKTHGNAKTQMSIRSYHWYAQAQPNVSGITRERIMDRMEDLADLVPMENVDFTKLTAKQWERLPGKGAVISATTQRNDIGLVVRSGQRYRIVPHPTETWMMEFRQYTWSNGLPNVFNTWANGLIPETKRGRILVGERKLLLGLMVMAVENGEPACVDIVSGAGRVFIGPHLPGGGSGKGSIRIKVIPVEDD